jgi:phenylacetate-CoA ligase
MTYLSADELRAYRDRRLAEAIEHCAATTPYYRERWHALGVDPATIRSLDDLALLPVLTRAEAQDAGSALFSTARFPHTSMYHTSGSTGSALRFPVTRRANQEHWATWWRFRGWHGIRKGTWQAQFAGRSVVPADQPRPPFWRLNIPGRQLLFSGFHMSDANLPAYVGELRKRRPPWLFGYPSHLAVLATHVVDEGVDLGYEFRWVTTAGENLMPHQAALIERAFGVAPLEHYGLAEGVANFSQCELRRLHVDEDFAATEFLPSEAPGQSRIVGTSWVNPATTFVRYDTADLATVAESATSCPCGRAGRIVESVDGRREDYVVLANGAQVGRLGHVFEDMVNVREAQIVQRRPGAILIRVVRRPEYGEDDESQLLRGYRKLLGEAMEIEVDHVAALPRSPVGKLRFVVSELEAPLEP